MSETTMSDTAVREASVRRDRLARLASDDGFFLVCAVDHLTEFGELVVPEHAGPPSHEEIRRAKLELIGAISEATSGVLIDAEYGAGDLRGEGLLPPSMGVAYSLENGDYSLAGPKRTVLRSGWDPAAASGIGADAVKLLWWYRPDSELADAQLETARSVVASAHESGLPLILEPIWHPLDGEEPSSAAWRQRRARGVFESGLLAQELGADLVKLEFPSGVGDPRSRDSRAETAELLSEFDAQLSVPWVILSAGVAYEEFRDQVELASEAGAAGYIAGRSLWRDAVSAPLDERAEAHLRVLSRLGELNEIVRSGGRAFARET